MYQWEIGLTKLLARNSLVVRWLGRQASITWGKCLIPGRGAKIPHATQCNQKFFNISRDFPGGPVAETPHSQRKGPEFDPLVRDLGPVCRN